MSEVRGTSWEDPHARGVVAERSYPASEVRGGDREDYPASEARGGGGEELLRARGQGRQLRGATPCPRSSGCMGTGEQRGAIPHSRSGGAVVRRYPLSSFKGDV